MHTDGVRVRTMRLDKYIKQAGDKAAAQLFGVAERTAASWRRGERIPSPEAARIIVSLSPVTFEGIYGAWPVRKRRAKTKS
jgi:transcriptional regulator with XRE-family HTH domain